MVHPLGQRFALGKNSSDHDDSHRLHDLAHSGDTDSLLNHGVCHPASNIGSNGHGDPRQYRVEARLHQVEAQHLVVVGRHPGQQDEGAPVVAEMGQDQGPDRPLGQDEFPGDFGAFSLQGRTYV